MRHLPSVLAVLLVTCARTLAAQDLPAWTLAPELRIGQLDDPVEALTYVPDVEVAPDGRIYIAQLSDARIRVFSPDGEFLHDIGRRGSGPGEFQRVDTLGITGAGVHVLDRSLGRTTLLTLSGEYVRQWRAPPHAWPGPLIGMPAQAFTRDGHMIVMPNYRVTGDRTVTRLPLASFDTSGAFRAEVAELNVSEQAVRVDAGGVRAVIPHPVPMGSLWAVARAEPILVVVDRDSAATGFRLVALSPATGDTLLRRSYRVRPVPISRESFERELATAVERNLRGNRPITREQVEAVYRAGWSVPEVQVPVDRVLIADDGAIWLRRGAFGLEVATWWVLDRNGDLTAQLRLPADLHPLRINATHVWGTRRGPYDEFTVHRWRIADQAPDLGYGACTHGRATETAHASISHLSRSDAP
jgi:hypothetical protein